MGKFPRAGYPGVLLWGVVAAVCGSRTDAPAATLAAAQPRHGEFGAETVKAGNATREYRLVVPKTVDLAKPAPLVVAFHGMLIDSKDVMPRYTHLSATAE